MLETNRIHAAVAQMETNVKDRIKRKLTTQAKVSALSKELDLSLLEYVKFQELKSLASAQGWLTLDEANTVYGYLGESVTTFNEQPVHVKAVLTQLFKELLGRRIKVSEAS